jgi:AraC family transcriptional regulator, ethanolamine operon transcriptional activator
MSFEELSSGPHLVEGHFDDIDAMAASPLAWDQEYEQIGRGRFEGHLTQLILDQLQLARVVWSPGSCRHSTAPARPDLERLKTCLAGRTRSERKYDH